MLLLVRCSARGGGVLRTVAKRRRPGPSYPHPFPAAAATAATAATAAASAATRALSTTSTPAPGGDSSSCSSASAAATDPSVVADAAGSWHAFIYDSVPVQGMQTVLEAIQAGTGLPWWASIALSTLAFRTALLPVVRYQARALARLAGAGPMLGALNQALSQRLDRIKPGDVASTTEACHAYAAGCSAALKVHRVSLAAAVASPLVQLPVFVTFALANRRMIDTAVPGLDAGGLAWFEDLTEADPLLILPLTCLASTYLNLELGFAKLHESQKVLRFVKDNLQLFLILGAPLSSTLPAGVFVYWLTSSLFGHAQHFGLKSPAVREALGFPALPMPPQAPAGAAAEAGAAGPVVMAATPTVGGGMVVDPRMMAKAMEALEGYEARRQRRLSQGGSGGGGGPGVGGSRDQQGGDADKGSSSTPPPGLSPFPKKRDS